MERLRTLRKRLVILYTSVLITIIVISASIIYSAIYYSIESTGAQSLRLSSAQLEGIYESYQTKEVSEDNYKSYLETLSDSNISYRIYNDELEVVESSSWLPLDSAQGKYLIERYFYEGNREIEFYNFNSGSESYKVSTEPFVSAQGELSVVQLIKNMSAERAFLRVPTITIIVIIVTGIMISTLLAGFFADRAIQPVEEDIKRDREFLRATSDALLKPTKKLSEALRKEPNLKELYGESVKSLTIAEALRLIYHMEEPETTELDLKKLLTKEVGEYTDQVSSEEAIILGSEMHLRELLRILREKMAGDTNQLKVLLTETPEAVILKIHSEIEELTGLEVVEMILEEHAAELRVTALEGAGTTLTMIFKNGHIRKT